MRTLVSLFLSFLFCIKVFVAFSAEWVGINNQQPADATIKLISSNVRTTVLSMTLKGFNKIAINTIDGEKFIVNSPGASPLLEKGAPDLVKLTASIIIPDFANMKVEVISSSYQDYTNINIAPSKGNVYRNVNPSAIAYSYADAYAKDEFYPGTLASLREPYILRDYRGQTVVFYPFQYNPVTKVLRVYSDMTIKVYEDNATVKSKNQFLRPMNPPLPSKEFQQVYNSIFKNPPALQYTLLSEQGNMLIISDASFMQAMEPYINWKKRKGIAVEMVDMATVGTTYIDVKDYVSDYYNTNGLTYLLLVGDFQEIPSPLISPAQTGGASDPSFGFITGADSYAEVFVGRFSAQSVADVETQVQRVLDYEVSPVAGAAGYAKGVCIGSDQGPGDDNEMDWEHERNIRTDLMAFTYTDIAELYDGDHHVGGVDVAGDPSNIDLFNEFQNGISIINYTGHGSNGSCGTTGFSTGDVANLTNFNMLPFMWSVACVNGEFNVGTCLAEALLRAQSGGQPTGAIATFMSSINQSWNPPMDGQDEMVDLLVGSSSNHNMRTFAGLSVNGCMHMNDIYGPAGAEMTDTWHCFGDPSLDVRTSPPSSMTVNHFPSVPLGTTQLQVNGNTDSALVSLTINGEIIGTGLILGGVSTITFSALSQIDTIDVTVTAFNKIPYLGIVKITGSGVGIPQNENTGKFVSVFPNPAKGQTVISLNILSKKELTVTIYDEKGNLVNRIANKLFAAGKHELNVNTNNFDAGTYFCRIVSDDKITSVPFTVVK